MVGVYAVNRLQANHLLYYQVWNRELEVSAQRWADQCVKHNVPDIQDTCRDLGKVTVGQNIATIHGNSPGLTPLALVDVWYMELLNINSSILSRYVPSSDTGHSHYDYFTQLMWEETNEVGCGGVTFKERLEDASTKYRIIYRLVCNFAPAGNFRNRSVYSTGVPCSRCPFDGICDPIHKALCSNNPAVINKDDSVVPTDSDILMGHATQQIEIFKKTNVIDTVTEYSSDSTEFTEKSPSINAVPKETLTPFDYFSHLYDYRRHMITSCTKHNLCKDVIMDDFVELLKKKLSNDPLLKDLLTTTTSSALSTYSDGTFSDIGVAAFVNKVYSKKTSPRSRKTTSSDCVNSTFLVDLIEAVIFRNGDRVSASEEYNTNSQTLSSVKSVKVQAELAEAKQNDDFTGHYFFPEEDEDSNTETTETYYDDVNLPVSDLVLDDLKMSTITNDFLEDILESDIIVESTTTLVSLSPDNINLYKSGHGVMKKFLQNIVDKPRTSQNNEQIFVD
ncbi:cell wall protein PRY3-like [Spodoptera litura]|uniref:Cell wall protein PRY3-like n=1 Tax=Spodoptera litura TaxID=69820 RepID=A0A9J7IRE4_SPOLT|nr:cell wall protein PRY3-like [Spodoptera litura]